MGGRAGIRVHHCRGSGSQGRSSERGSALDGSGPFHRTSGLGTLRPGPCRDQVTLPHWARRPSPSGGPMSGGPLRGRSERGRRRSRGSRGWRRPGRADRACVPRSAPLVRAVYRPPSRARPGSRMARWRSMARPRATTALARLAAFSGERSAYDRIGGEREVEHPALISGRLPSNRRGRTPAGRPIQRGATRPWPREPDQSLLAGPARMGVERPPERPLFERGRDRGSARPTMTPTNVRFKSRRKYQVHPCTVVDAPRPATGAPLRLLSHHRHDRITLGSRLKPLRHAARILSRQARASPVPAGQMDEWQGIVFDGWFSTAAQTTIS